MARSDAHIEVAHVMLHTGMYHQVVLPINLYFITCNIEISLKDLIYENVRVENYLQDHVYLRKAVNIKLKLT